jgi:hypothetical protein
MDAMNDNPGLQDLAMILSTSALFQFMLVFWDCDHGWAFMFLDFFLVQEITTPLTESDQVHGEVALF